MCEHVKTPTPRHGSFMKHHTSTQQNVPAPVALVGLQACAMLKTSYPRDLENRSWLSGHNSITIQETTKEVLPLEYYYVFGFTLPWKKSIQALALACSVAFNGMACVTNCSQPHWMHLKLRTRNYRSYALPWTRTLKKQHKIRTMRMLIDI